MTKRAHADAWNLTGIWNGNYTYPRGLGDVSFVATLIEAGSHVTGSTHEPHSFEPSTTLLATLTGRREGQSVSFVKTCDNGGWLYAAPIQYEGTLTEDGTEIEGCWTIQNEWSGKFLMIRSGNRLAAAARKKAEKV